MMNILAKFLILIFKDWSIFSAPYLRNFRWFIYRYYYKAPRLYVDTGVTISTAHTNNNSFFNNTGELHLGKGVYIDYSGGVTIGHRVAISEGAKIYTHNHSIHDGYADWHKNDITFSPLSIDNFAWIGANSLIMPSVQWIGEGAIIAAGAVLTKDAEAFCIYAGNPAKCIGKRRVKEDK